MATQITPGWTLTGTWHVHPRAERSASPCVRCGACRRCAGLAWNKLGMIRGDAHLEVDLELVRG